LGVLSDRRGDAPDIGYVGGRRRQIETESASSGQDFYRFPGNRVARVPDRNTNRGGL